MRRERIPASQYAADDAVQSGFRQLYDDLLKGKLDSVEAPGDCSVLLRIAVAERVIAERKRRAAAKRGGPGAQNRAVIGSEDSPSDPPPGPTTYPPDQLDLLESGLPAPDVLFISHEVVQQFRGRLDPTQARLLDMRLDGQSIPAIARGLRVSTRTVQRRFEEIRVIWRNSRLLEPD